MSMPASRVQRFASHSAPEVYPELGESKAVYYELRLRDRLYGHLVLKDADDSPFPHADQWYPATGTILPFL